MASSGHVSPLLRKTDRMKRRRLLNQERLMLSSSLTLSDPPSEEEEAHAEGIATGAARRLAIAQAMLSKQQHQKLASPSPTVSALPNAGNRTPPAPSNSIKKKVKCWTNSMFESDSGSEMEATPVDSQTPSSLRASTTMKSLRHLQSAEVQGEGSKDDTPSELQCWSSPGTAGELSDISPTTVLKFDGVSTSSPDNNTSLGTGETLNAEDTLSGAILAAPEEEDRENTPPPSAQPGACPSPKKSSMAPGRFLGASPSPLRVRSPNVPSLSSPLGYGSDSSRDSSLRGSPLLAGSILHTGQRGSSAPPVASALMSTRTKGCPIVKWFSEATLSDAVEGGAKGAEEAPSAAVEPINCHVLAGSLEHPQEPDYKGEELQPPGADQSPPPGGQKPGEAETPLFPFADGPPSGSATSWLLPTSPGSFSFGSGISSCGASPQPGLENHGQHDEAPTPWLTHKYKQTSPTSPALPSCSQFLPVSWRSRAPKVLDEAAASSSSNSHISSLSLGSKHSNMSIALSGRGALVSPAPSHGSEASVCNDPAAAEDLPAPEESPVPPQHSSKVADVPESSSLRKAAALLLEASPDSSKGLLDDLLEAAIASAAGDERSIESEADSIERWLINSSRPSKSAGLPQVSFSESLMGLAAVGSTSVSPATGQIRQPLPTKIPRRPRTSRAPASDPGDVTKFQDDVDSLLESLQASRANARQDLDMEGTRRPERLPSFAQTDVDLFINSLAGSKKGAEGPKVQGDTASVHVLVRAGLSPVGEDTIDSARDDLAPCSVGYVSQLGPRVSVKSLETEELWTLSKERPQSGPPLSPEVFEMPLNLDGLSLTSESPGPLWLPGPSPHVEQSLDLRPPCAPPAAVANLSGTSSGSPKQRCGWVAGWSLSVVLLIASAGAVILAAWALCPDAASSFYRNLGVPVPVAMPNGHARIPQGDISSTALSAFPSQEPESQFFLAEELVHPVGQDSFVDGTFCLDHDVDFSPTGPAPFDAVAMDQCEPFELLLRHWCNWGSETIYLQEESSNTDKELQILTAVDPLGSQGLDLTLTAVDPLGLDLILPDWNGMEGLARGILAEGYEDSNRDSAGGSDGHAAQLQDLVAELDNLVVAGSSPDFERFGDEEVDKYRSGLPLREEPMAEVDGFVAATESRRPSNFDEDEEVPEPSTGWPLDFQDLLAELDGLIVEGKFLNKLEPVITAEDIGDAEDTDTQRRPSAGPKPEVPNNSTASGSSSFLAKIAGALPPGVARSGMQTINWALHCGAAGVIANAIRGAISRRVHRGFGRPSRIF